MNGSVHQHEATVMGAQQSAHVVSSIQQMWSGVCMIPPLLFYSATESFGAQIDRVAVGVVKGHCVPGLHYLLATFDVSCVTHAVTSGSVTSPINHETIRSPSA